MLLANPIWLWALAGLSIPIGIHLLSRKEGKVIRVGSLRHLHETNTQQFKGIRLNEIVLLILRCALITLFVLMMCGLSFEKSNKSDTKWVLIEKGLENLPMIQTQLDTFRSNGYELRWLSDGFPLYGDSASVISNNLYWRLVEQFQEESADEIVIISKNFINNFKGKRPRQPSNIRWVSVPVSAIDFTASARPQGDKIIVRKGRSEADKTYFVTHVFPKSEWESPTQLRPTDSIEVMMMADDIHRYDRRIAEASLQALRSLNPVKLTNGSFDQISSLPFGNWCVWLSDQPVPDSVQTNIIYLKPALNQQILIQEKNNRWVITKRLNEEVVLNEGFTVKLASILFSFEKDWEAAYLNDKRMLPDESVWSNNNSDGAKNGSSRIQAADSYLLLLFLLTFLVERILAYYRNQ